MLPGRVEKQREGATGRCTFTLLGSSRGPCKINDAGDIGTEGEWRGKCLVAQGEASVSINPFRSVNLLILP